MFPVSSIQRVNNEKLLRILLTPKHFIVLESRTNICFVLKNVSYLLQKKRKKKLFYNPAHMFHFLVFDSFNKTFKLYKERLI